jgi:DNA-directed RNA polymerase specialized sigma24 family protein
VRRFHAPLVAVASGITGSSAQAEEVVQHAWLAVHGAIARFAGRSSLASWLYTIVLNRARAPLHPRRRWRRDASGAGWRGCCGRRLAR